MKKLRVGIIGVGSIAHEHIQAYQKMPHVELVALCDINTEQLEKMGKQYEVPQLYKTKEALLEKADVDAVSVCVWNSAHAECAIAALNAGKHVLCEKPMATTVEDAQAMQAAAEANDRLLMIGFVRRFGNDTKIIMDFKEKDFFGEIYYGKATYLRRHGNPEGWFGDQSRSGGGPLIDLGVHVIDLLTYLLGKSRPVSVYGATFQKLFNRPDVKDKQGYISSTPGEIICDVEDLASAMIRFENGSVISIETSFSLNVNDDQQKLELFGTKGGAALNPSLKLSTNINGYMADVQLKMPTALSMDGLFYNEIHHFVECVLEGKDCLSPAQDGVVITQIIEAIYESAKTGHEVTL